MGYPQKNEFKNSRQSWHHCQLASTGERPAQLRPTALKSYQARTLTHLAETGSPMDSWKPWIRFVSPGLLPIALLRAVLNRKVEAGKSGHPCLEETKSCCGLPWKHRSWVGYSTPVFSKLCLVKAFFEAVRFQVGGNRICLLPR